MTHRYYLVIFSLVFFLFYHLNSLIAQDCQISTAVTDLDANNAKARLAVGGDLWWSGGDGEYIIPQPDPGEPEVSAFHLAGMWIGGFDSGNNTKLAAQTYGRASGKSDYFPGPLTESGTTTLADCNNYDRFWSTNSADINQHIDDLNDNGIIDGPIPQSVLAWPGRGNPNFETIHGFELPNTSQGMAPFIDVNFDEVYNPFDGDYPNINGADQAE